MTVYAGIALYVIGFCSIAMIGFAELLGGIYAAGTTQMGTYGMQEAKGRVQSGLEIIAYALIWPLVVLIAPVVLVACVAIGAWRTFVPPLAHGLVVVVDAPAHIESIKAKFAKPPSQGELTLVEPTSGELSYPKEGGK